MFIKMNHWTLFIYVPEEREEMYIKIIKRSIFKIPKIIIIRGALISVDHITHHMIHGP
jgi:hypothetical protein